MGKLEWIEKFWTNWSQETKVNSVKNGIWWQLEFNFGDPELNFDTKKLKGKKAPTAKTETKVDPDQLSFNFEAWEVKKPEDKLTITELDKDPNQDELYKFDPETENYWDR